MGRYIKTATGALIAANVVMFIVFHLAVAIWGAGASAFFGLQPVPWPWVWTPLTYMFTQHGALDLLFNLLWLYMFSRMFMEAGVGRQLLTAYFCGGFGGAVFFIAAGLSGLSGGMLFGSSAAALGVIVCAAMRTPKMRVMLMFFGSVEYRVIAAIAVGLSLLSFAGANVGGGFAHLGGAAGGLLAAMIIRRQMRFRVIMPGQRKPQREKTLDELLDKVRRSGYASLSTDERRQLLEYSKKLQ